MQKRNKNLPLPDLPMKRRSLNLATWFFMTAVPLRSSALQFSSLPARTVTNVPSSMLPRQTTLNAAGRVLLERQWVGREEHKTHGLPVRTNSPPIPGKLMLCCRDGGMDDDDGPHPAELDDDAGRAPLTPAKDVIASQSRQSIQITETRSGERRRREEGKKEKKSQLAKDPVVASTRRFFSLFLFLSLFFSSPLAEWQQSRNVCNQVSSLLLLGRSSEIGFLIFEIRRRSSNDYDEFCSRHHSAVNHAQFLSINFICSAATNSGSRRRRRRK